MSDLKKCDNCGKTIKPGQAASKPAKRMKDGKTERYRVHTEKKDCSAIGR
jgi:hypothetical protein